MVAVTQASPLRVHKFLFLGHLNTELIEILEATS